METKRTVQIEIIQAPLPATIHGAVMPAAAGSAPEAYTVFINAGDPEERQALSFVHECLHIWHSDLNRTGEKAADIEEERREELHRILKALENPN